MPQLISILPDRAIFKISGSEAKTFLQGLVTADLEKLEDGQASHAGLLTPQGKIMFDFFALAQKDGWLIDCSTDQVDDIIKRLTFYKLRADVNLEKLQDWGIAASWGEPVSVPDEIIVYDDPRLKQMGQRLVSPMTMLSPLENQPAQSYHAHRIGLGVPDTPDIGSSQTFPHEANFDQLGGVSFTKGCYVGQEVVSRMQHRGTARSRIIMVELADELTGDEREITANDRKIGQMLSVAGTKGLAIVRLDRAKKAMEEGHAILVGDIPVKLKKPDWANFEM